MADENKDSGVTPGGEDKTFIEEIANLTEIVRGLSKSVKSLEKFHQDDSESISTVVSQVGVLEKTLVSLQKTQEEHNEKQISENQWKNRRVVSLLDRITIVIGALIALIATFFAGKGMFK